MGYIKGGIKNKGGSRPLCELCLTEDNLTSLDSNLLTPRNLHRVVNGLYDLPRLISPISSRLRVAFRNVFNINKNVNWDTPLSAGRQQGCWLILFKMLTEAPPVTLKRCFRPITAVGSCSLVCYFDGSDDAFAGVMYIRWMLEDGSVRVNLLCSKPRVTPSKRITTPRSELNAALLASRLALSTVTSLTNACVPIEKLYW